MVPLDDFTAAMANRSLRTLRTELEFLSELSVLSPQQVSSILAELPADGQQSRQLQQPVQPAAQPAPPPQPVPQPIQEAIPPPVVPVQHSPAPYLPPTNQFANTTLNKKAPTPQFQPPPVPPPAYQGPAVLSIASAVYEYKASEAGDLSFLPRDRIQVLEHMNNDWWRGHNERTGQDGIFPSSYVDVMSDKGAAAPPPPPPSGYGNMPLGMSQTGAAPAVPAEPDGKNGKFEQHGKKFGKKMGNAAILGAGATMGSNLVNSIF